MQLGHNIKKYRKAQGLTQGELAQALFVTTQAVSKWERGESEPGIAHICQLSKLLKVTTDNLLGVKSDTSALLAVDGGGTKTEFLLIDAQGQPLHRILLPGANPNSCSREGSFQIFCQGIDAMLQLPYAIAGVFIGCAGMAAGGNDQAITQLLNRQYPQIPIRCSSDIYNIIACAPDPDNAIAVICGTGSVVYSTSDGVLTRTGGGGWLIDPVGSGFGIGRAALLAALEDRDGTGKPTALTALLEEKLGGTVWDNIRAVCDSSPKEIASYAPLVIQAWQQGDPVATQIIEAHTDRLAQLIICAGEKSPLAKDIMLGGSLLTKCAPFRALLGSKLPEKLSVYPIQYPPIWGACLQSAVISQLPKPNFDCFITQYEEMVALC